MDKIMKKESELNQEIKQESKVDQSANRLDEDTLDSVTGGMCEIYDRLGIKGHVQGRSTGGGSRGADTKPAPVFVG